MDRLLKYSIIFFDIAALFYDIILFTNLSLKYNGKTKSSVMFKKLVYYIIFATLFDISSSIIIINFPDLYFGVALIMISCKSVLTIFISYYVSLYIASYTYDDILNAPFHKFNKIFLYFVLINLNVYIVSTLLFNYRPTAHIYMDYPLDFLVNTLTPIYFFIYSGRLLYVKRSQITKKMFIILIISYFFFIFGIIGEVFSPHSTKFGYLGISLGIYILYFTIEFPDYQRLVSTMSELSIAKEAANQANEAKTNFLSNMSHEIRTPLNAILGLDEIIIRQSKEDEIKNYAKDIQNASESLLSIINDILDFSKIEAQKLELFPNDYSIVTMVNDLKNMIMPRVTKKALKFEIDIDPNIPRLLHGDSVRIKQVIVNLLTNAVKYTHSGVILFSISAQDTTDSTTILMVSVKDTGIGMKRSELDKLFLPFERLEENKNKTIEGSGLGMAIVKQLLSMMNSNLIVKSVYGEGSEFSFKLEQIVVDTRPIGNLSEIHSTAESNVSVYNVSFTAPKAKILVVDDTEMNLLVFKGLLKDTKMQIDTVTNANEMFARIKSTKYDLIFIDHRMPVMDGVEALHYMKTFTHQCLDTPCIALTANVLQGAREYYIEEGFRDYLSKPVNSKKLEECITQYLPPSLIIKTSEDVIFSEKNIKYNPPAVETSNNGADTIQERYSDKVFGINFDIAQTNCVTTELWEESAKNFYKMIPTISQEIQEYFAVKDYENYTIKVHALKSSARLIGAMELSDLAAQLEKYGDSKEIEQIELLTPTLIHSLEAYTQNLFYLMPSVNENSKPELIEDDFESAMDDLSECIEAFDFNTAERIIVSLDNYRIPDDKKEFYQQISDAILQVDRDLAKKLFEDRMK